MDMTTTEQLAQKMAFTAQLTEQQSLSAIQAMSSSILVEVRRGRAVELQGFGLFDMAPRTDGSNGIRFRQHNNVREALNP